MMGKKILDFFLCRFQLGVSTEAKVLGKTQKLFWDFFQKKNPSGTLKGSDTYIGKIHLIDLAGSEMLGDDQNHYKLVFFWLFFGWDRMDEKWRKLPNSG